MNVLISLILKPLGNYYTSIVVDFDKMGFNQWQKLILNKKGFYNIWKSNTDSFNICNQLYIFILYVTSHPTCFGPYWSIIRGVLGCLFMLPFGSCSAVVCPCVRGRWLCLTTIKIYNWLHLLETFILWSIEEARYRKPKKNLKTDSLLGFVVGEL
jgi:hypothetical protein